MFLALVVFSGLVIYFLYRLVSNVWTVSNLKDRPVLVTGCDTGFGHLLALRLVENGIPTFAGCLTEKGETELRKAAASAPGKLCTFQLDVTKQESVNAAYAFVKTQLGPEKGLWGVVNNAGVLGQCGPDDWMTVEMYEKVLDVNTLGVIRVTHAFKPLIKLGKGRIVIITSIFGRVCVPGFGPYCVSKFATEAYADAIRVELKCFDISVHILEPGLHVTNITNSKTIAAAWLDLWQSQPGHIQEEYGNEYLKQCTDRLIKEFDSVNGDANCVVEAYYHALTSRFPKLRYVVGFDAQFMYLPLAYLPTFVGDFVFDVMLRLKKVPAPRVCQKA